MSQGFLDKLKKTVIAGAATSAAKVEEAAKTGKLHLDLINEKRKLGTQFSKLGETVYAKVQDSKFETLAEDEEFITLIGSISENKASILDLETKLKESNTPSKDTPEEKPSETEASPSDEKE